MQRTNQPLYPGEHVVTKAPDTSDASISRALTEAADMIDAKAHKDIRKSFHERNFSANVLRKLARSLDAAPEDKLNGRPNAEIWMPDDAEQIRREERERYDADREHMALRIRQAESAARVLLEKLTEIATYQAPAPIILAIAPASDALTGVRALYSEVDCRIEHGAESGGHLEFVREQLRALVSDLDQ